ncbi:MAG: wax ester/triacylglycerol synthase family O-acyltransferase [SAR324 cluster bacterium]|nr:wax ester/triacylglycerol synthase family O-acyltransferase [SAR324 cluster bacterium]
MKRLNIIDTVFLQIETREQLMHVASVLILKKPESYDGDYFKDLVTGMRQVKQFIEPFNQKLKYPPFKLGLPHWVVDDNIDLDFHIRHSAIPGPGTYEQLYTLISRLHSSLLDRSRPLWEFHIIEGLEGDRFAIYFKVHHACIDGLGRMKAIQRILNTSPENRKIRAPWQAVPDEKKDNNEPVEQAFLERIKAQISTVPELINLLLRSTGYLTEPHKMKAPLPFNAPVSSINVVTSAQRRFANQDLPLADIKQIGKTMGATVNDVVMVICSGALRHYLLKHHDLPEKSLIAFVPVSIQTQSKGHVSNQLSNILCKLGTDVADPLERLRIIVESSKEGKEKISGLSKEAAQNLMLILQSPMFTIQLLQMQNQTVPAFNLVISNYPGPKEQLYLNGATMEAIYPVSFLFGGQGLNITVTSYHGKLCFGLLACRDGIPKIQELAKYLSESFEELKRAVYGTTGM